MRTKGLFKSIGALGSLVSIVTGLIGWFDQLPPELITDTRAFAVMVITGFIALYGRWKAQVPLSGLFGGKVELLPPRD